MYTPVMVCILGQNDHGLCACMFPDGGSLPTQVSDLSHKLGAAEGCNRSFEQEIAQLRADNMQLAQSKHQLDITANESKAKLLALEGKVGHLGKKVYGVHSLLTNMLHPVADHIAGSAAHWLW